VWYLPDPMPILRTRLRPRVGPPALDWDLAMTVIDSGWGSSGFAAPKGACSSAEG
jgi:hypothetical protein